MNGLEQEEEHEEGKEDDKFGGFDDAAEAAFVCEDEDEALRSQHQELEAEVTGLPFSGSTKSSAKKSTKTKKHEAGRRKEEEKLERQRMTMSRKLLDKDVGLQ